MKISGLNVENKNICLLSVMDCCFKFFFFNRLNCFIAVDMSHGDKSVHCYVGCIDRIDILLESMNPFFKVNIKSNFQFPSVSFVCPLDSTNMMLWNSG